MGFRVTFFITTLAPFVIAAATAKKKPLDGSVGTVIFNGFKWPVNGWIFIKPSLSYSIFAWQWGGFGKITCLCLMTN